MLVGWVAEGAEVTGLGPAVSDNRQSRQSRLREGRLLRTYHAGAIVETKLTLLQHDVAVGIAEVNRFEQTDRQQSDCRRLRRFWHRYRLAAPDGASFDD